MPYDGTRATFGNWRDEIVVTSIDPQELFNQLMSGDVHPSKKKGLEIIHAICRERFEAKATSWAVASIGRLSEERGGPTAESLRQPKLEYYRSLIKAWEIASKTANPHERKRSANTEDWIQGIEDLTRRQLAYIMRRDLEMAQAEVRRLKRLLPDEGVLKVSLSSSSAPSGTAFDPTPSQIRAIRRFVQQFLEKPELLKDKGLIVKSGSLLDADTGEVIAEKPAVEAIRSIAQLSGQ